MSDVNSVTEKLACKCRKFESRFRSRRIAVMVRDFYLPDAVMEGRDLPPQVGHLAITNVFAEARQTCASIEIELGPVKVVGAVAFGGITNRNTSSGGVIEIHRGMMIWQEIDGEWFVARDFFFAEHNLLFSDLGLVSPLPRRAKASPGIRKAGKKASVKSADSREA